MAKCKCGKIIEPAYEVTGKCEDCFADGRGHLFKRRKNPLAELDLENSEEPKKDPLELSISELDLDGRTDNLLCAAGIVFIKDLVKKTEADLMAIKRFGKGSLLAVKAKLQERGLALKPQKVNWNCPMPAATPQ